MEQNTSLRAGVVGGTIITILGHITWSDIEKTLVLGLVGAVVSYLASFLMKKLLARWDDKGSSEDSPVV